MKKTMKLISILMVALMIMMVGTPVFAEDNEANAAGDTGTSIKFSEIENDLKAKAPEQGQSVVQLVGKVLGFIQWATIIGGVIIIAVLGVKYMMGSLEEKSQYQKSFVPLIVGIIVVAGATSIAKILFNTFSM